MKQLDYHTSCKNYQVAFIAAQNESGEYRFRMWSW
jgi:hypothetical protein